MAAPEGSDFETGSQRTHRKDASRMPLNLSKDAILAAQIVPMPAPGGGMRYVAMVSVSKGPTSPGVWGTDVAESFPAPQEALNWLRQMLGSATFPDSIEKPK